MFNRQSVSRMLESCLVLEVWLEYNLVGIARVPTDKEPQGVEIRYCGGSQGGGGGWLDW